MNPRKMNKKITGRAIRALLLAALLTVSLVTALACGGGDKPLPSVTATQAPSESGQGQDTQPTEEEKVKAYDFTLSDQYGTMHTLSAYEGKVIFLNFWATWCPPCMAELPDVEQLYKDHQVNQDGLAVLGVVYPGVGKEMDEEGIKSFLLENDISFPVLMDVTGEVYETYRITGMPTTFMIDHRGDFIGYVQGALSRELMDLYVNQALEERDQVSP